MGKLIHSRRPSGIELRLFEMQGRMWLVEGDSSSARFTKLIRISGTRLGTDTSSASLHSIPLNYSAACT
jgi:hypothetical protein